MDCTRFRKFPTNVLSHNGAPFYLLQATAFPPLTKSWIGIWGSPLWTSYRTHMPSNSLWETQSHRQHGALKMEFSMGKMKFTLLCMIYDASYNPTSLCFSRPDLLPPLASSCFIQTKVHQVPRRPSVHSLRAPRVLPNHPLLSPVSPRFSAYWVLKDVTFSVNPLLMSPNHYSYPFLDSHNTLLLPYFIIPFR